MDRTDRAWAAGFWDGEGSAYLSGPADRATRQPRARVNQASTAGIPEVLTRFQGALGFGVIQGPDMVDGREPLYRWVVSRRAEVSAVLAYLRPWLGEVKRRQLCEVLGSSDGVADDLRDQPETEGIAWAAGLWDGEGCVSRMAHRSHDGYFILEASITQSSECGVPEVLERFRSVVQAGKIYGPYDAGPERQPVYRWKLVRTAEIHRVMALLGLQIGVAKRVQAARHLAVVLSQPALPRGNPVWGSHKTRCVRGHDYATARVRPFRGRGRNTEAPRASHQCLACVREDAREHRARQRRKRTDQPPFS